MSQTITWFFMVLLPQMLGGNTLPVPSQDRLNISFEILVAFGLIELLLAGYGLFRRRWHHEMAFIEKDDPLIRFLNR